MLEICGNLARNLVLIVFVNLLLEMLLPQGHFQRYIRLVTGLIVVVLVVGAINVFLGKVPAYFEAVPTAALIAPQGADATREQLLRFNRKQALSLYTAFLEEAVRREVEQEGLWSLVEMELMLEDDPEHARYGDLYRLKVAVKKAAAGAGGEVEAVRVDPVTMEPTEPGADDGAAVDEPQRQRVAALERALAERLQLAPGIVTVTVVE
ncbi:MAG: hypothetical protein GX044_10090 [Firmicutes bacterium]|jgi:stage III sporulation protein AF|nr:hypothetical protein [Bacillota bacterium]